MTARVRNLQSLIGNFEPKRNELGVIAIIFHSANPLIVGESQRA
jgi:hypothetical protein